MGKSIDGKELGEGISQRRSDGLYCARYTNRLGKRKAIYGKNLRKLKQDLKHAMKEDDEKDDLLQDFTLNQWFDFWMENYKEGRGLSELYLDNIVRYYNIYVRKKGNVDITKFRNMDAQRIINTALKQSKTAGESVRHTLVQMLDKAVDNAVVTRNVCRSIEPQRRNKDRKEPLSKQDEKMLLKGCRSQLHKDMIELNINTGLRISELLGLTFDEIDLENKKIYIRHQLSAKKNEKEEYYLMETKTKRERVIPLNDKSLAILKRNIKKREKELAEDKYRRYKSEISDQLVFVGHHGDCITRLGFHSILRYITKHAEDDGYEYNCQSISPHTFRHTFATRCMEAGMSPNSVSTLLGHTTVRMTLHYIHNSKDQFNEDVELINEI